jgi:hypothetical protein
MLDIYRVYLYIYIYIERERESIYIYILKDTCKWMDVCVQVSQGEGGQPRLQQVDRHTQVGERIPNNMPININKRFQTTINMNKRFQTTKYK